MYLSKCRQWLLACLSSGILFCYSLLSHIYPEMYPDHILHCWFLYLIHYCLAENWLHARCICVFYFHLWMTEMQYVIPIQIAQKMVRHSWANSVILEISSGLIQHRLRTSDTYCGQDAYWSLNWGFSWGRIEDYRAKILV